MQNNDINSREDYSARAAERYEAYQNMTPEEREHNPRNPANAPTTQNQTGVRTLGDSPSNRATTVANNLLGINRDLRLENLDLKLKNIEYKERYNGMRSTVAAIVGVLALGAGAGVVAAICELLTQPGGEKIIASINVINNPQLPAVDVNLAQEVIDNAMDEWSQTIIISTVMLSAFIFSIGALIMLYDDETKYTLPVIASSFTTFIGFVSIIVWSSSMLADIDGKSFLLERMRYDPFLSESIIISGSIMLGAAILSALVVYGIERLCEKEEADSREI